MIEQQQSIPKIVPNSNVLIPVYDEMQQRMKKLALCIPTKWLSASSPTPGNINIFVRWGQDTSDVNRVRELVRSFGPITLHVGFLGLRTIQGRRVLIHHLQSHRLEGLRELLNDNFFGCNDEPWIPYIPIAHLPIERAEKALAIIGGKRGSATLRMSILTGTKFVVNIMRVNYFGSTNSDIIHLST